MGASSSNLGVVLLALVISAFFLRLNAWRALLFVRPSRVNVEPDAPGDQMKLPETLMPVALELAALGFKPLGSRSERTPLSPEFVSYEYANPQEHAYATLHAGRFGGPRLYFITPLQGGGMVLSANYRRPSRRLGQEYLAGGLPNAPAGRLLKFHQKRLEGLQPDATYTQEARVELARRWFAGPGRSEIRLQNLNGLVSSVLSGVLFLLATLAGFAILARR